VTLVVGRLVLDKSGWIRFSSWPLLAGNKFLKKKRKKKYLPTFVPASFEGQWWCVDSWVADENVKTMSCSDDGWLDLTQQLPYHSPAASFLEKKKILVPFCSPFVQTVVFSLFSAPSGTPEFLFLILIVFIDLLIFFFRLDVYSISIFGCCLYFSFFFQKESRILQIIFSQINAFQG